MGDHHLDDEHHHAGQDDVDGRRITQIGVVDTPAWLWRLRCLRNVEWNSAARTIRGQLSKSRGEFEVAFRAVKGHVVLSYDVVPIRIGFVVGVIVPPEGSMVTSNPLASMPGGIGVNKDA